MDGTTAGHGAGMSFPGFSGYAAASDDPAGDISEEQLKQFEGMMKNMNVDKMLQDLFTGMGNSEGPGIDVWACCSTCCSGGLGISAVDGVGELLCISLSCCPPAGGGVRACCCPPAPPVGQGGIFDPIVLSLSARASF